MRDSAETHSCSVYRIQGNIGAVRPNVSQRNLLLCVLLVFSSSPLLGGSRSEAFGKKGLPARNVPAVARGTNKASISFASKYSMLLSSPQSGDEEDDGWGSPALEQQKSNFDRDRKVNELRYLREEASNKAPSYAPSSGESEPERDTFIPILSVVSLLGLFGAYGYETLRLASRGELYLPF